MCKRKIFLNYIYLIFMCKKLHTRAPLDTTTVVQRNGILQTVWSVSVFFAFNVWVQQLVD